MTPRTASTRASKTYVSPGCSSSSDQLDSMSCSRRTVKVAKNPRQLPLLAPSRMLPAPFFCASSPTCDTTTSTCAMKRARIFAVFFLLLFPASIAQQPLQLPAEQDMCPNKPFGFGRNQSSIGMQPVQSAARLLFLPLPFEVYDRIFAPICAFLRGDDYGTSLVVKVYSGPHENLIRTQVLRISGE